MSSERNGEIDNINCQIRLLESTVEQRKADADKFSFAAEKKMSCSTLRPPSQRLIP